MSTTDRIGLAGQESSVEQAFIDKARELCDVIAPLHIAHSRPRHKHSFAAAHILVHSFASTHSQPLVSLCTHSQPLMAILCFVHLAVAHFCLNSVPSLHEIVPHSLSRLPQIDASGTFYLKTLPAFRPLISFAARGWTACRIPV